MSMSLEDAQRLIASLNALRILFKGSSEEEGLILALEKASVKINQAVDSLNGSTKDLAKHILEQGLEDKLINLLEANLPKAIKKIGDEASLTSMRLLVDKSIQAIQSNSNDAITKAIELALESSNVAQITKLEGKLLKLENRLEESKEKIYKTNHLAFRLKNDSEILLQEKNSLLDRNEALELVQVKLQKQNRVLKLTALGATLALAVALVFASI